jgi:hypothetical protein
MVISPARLAGREKHEKNEKDESGDGSLTRFCIFYFIFLFLTKKIKQNQQKYVILENVVCFP